MDKTANTGGGGGIIGRTFRIIIFFCTLGFVFPHALVEDDRNPELDKK